MLKFQINYFIIAIAIFIIELLIALFIREGFIRFSVGDFLVVVLIYCLLKSFLNLSFLKTAIFVLLFSYTVEILQYFKIVEKLGLQNFKIARIIIGTSFSWADIMMYTLGIIFVLFMERMLPAKNNIPLKTV